MLTDKFGLYAFVCIEQVGFHDTLLKQDLSTATIPAISPRFSLNSLFSLVFFGLLARNFVLSGRLQAPYCRRLTYLIIVQERTLATSYFDAKKTELRKFWTVFDPDAQNARRAKYLGSLSLPAGEMCRLRWFLKQFD